jgi:hypothetical protein
VAWAGRQHARGRATPWWDIGVSLQRMQLLAATVQSCSAAVVVAVSCSNCLHTGVLNSRGVPGRSGVVGAVEQSRLRNVTAASRMHSVNHARPSQKRITRLPVSQRLESVKWPLSLTSQAMMLAGVGTALVDDLGLGPIGLPRCCGDLVDHFIATALTQALLRHQSVLHVHSEPSKPIAVPLSAPHRRRPKTVRTRTSVMIVATV